MANFKEENACESDLEGCCTAPGVCESDLEGCCESVAAVEDAE